MHKKRTTTLVIIVAAATIYFACTKAIPTAYHGKERAKLELSGKDESSLPPAPSPEPVSKPKSDEGAFYGDGSSDAYGASPTREIVIEERSEVYSETITSEYKTTSKDSRKKEKFRGEAMPMEAADYEWSAEVDGYDDAVSSKVVESKVPEGSAGILTAGEINDFSKWELWQDITADEFKQHSETWRLNAHERTAVQLKTASGKRVVDAVVNLKDKNGIIIWTTRTDNTGKAELWSNFFEGEENMKGFSLEIVSGKKIKEIQSPSTFHNGVNVIEMPESCDISNNVDVAFMVDATGSMGDEINYLKAELTDIIGKVKTQHPELKLNLGSVFYRDITDDYLTRVSPLSSDITVTTNFIAEQSAGGGGDFPEAVDEGLLKSVNELNWSEEARARMLFVVLDAPPHQTDAELAKIKEAVKVATAKGIRIVPITASGIDKSTEFLMRSLALATNGTYVFLTDHSGVGNPHIEPTTDKYEVELLNDLMIRLINQYIEVPPCETATAEFYKEEIEGDTLFVETAENIKSVDSTNLEASIDSLTPAVKVSSLKFYPNPTFGNITLEVEGEIKEVFLADMSGKLVKRITLEGTDKRIEQINIGEFPSGTYVLQYMTGEKWNAGKLVLLH